MNEEDKNILRERVIAVLSGIYDPEIPVDIYRLKLIYEINIDDEGNVGIVMTVTTPNCPVAEYLPNHVREKVSAIMGVKSCTVQMTFEPAWTPDVLPQDVRDELGLDDGFGVSDMMY